MPKKSKSPAKQKSANTNGTATKRRGNARTRAADSADHTDENTVVPLEEQAPEPVRRRASSRRSGSAARPAAPAGPPDAGASIESLTFALVVGESEDALGRSASTPAKLPATRIPKRDLAAIQDSLYAIRATLTHDVDALTRNTRSQTGREMAGDANGHGLDMADVASESSARDLELSIATGETRRLRLVEAALERLRDGSFGRCVACAQPVGVPRLKAIPYADLCIACAEAEELGLI